jgi:hypothetical protein
MNQLVLVGVLAKEGIEGLQVKACDLLRPMLRDSFGIALQTILVNRDERKWIGGDGRHIYIFQQKTCLLRLTKRALKENCRRDVKALTEPFHLLSIQSSLSFQDQGNNTLAPKSSARSFKDGLQTSEWRM